MEHEAARGRRARGGPARTMAALALAALVACTTSAPPASEQPTIVVASVEATSRTSVRVTFDGPVDPASAADAARFAVAGPAGALAVHAVHLRPDPHVVVLATAPQQLVPYALTVAGVAHAEGVATTSTASFAGSDVPAPVLASAMALDPERVLLHFENPRTGAAAELESAPIDARGIALAPTSVAALGAGFAAHGDDRTRVIVATSPMDDATYAVTASLMAAGGIPVDPTGATASFRGIAPVDVVAPEVLAVRALSDTRVRVWFSEPVGASAADPASYLLADADGTAVPVVAAARNDVATEVTLQTWPMALSAGHELVVRAVVLDASGNPVAANATPFTVPVGGAPPPDDRAPRVVGAISTSATTLLVTFDEPVAGGLASAENPLHYAIVDVASASGIAPSAVLLVQQAVLSANRRTVTLTTLQQSPLEYAVRVANVTDLAGNMVVGPDRDRPYQVTFFGTGVTGPAVDTDGDGISDAAEQAGWTVRVRLGDGRIETRVVTSDPFEADTDGDGVSDLDERTYGTDPRSPDTDRDGLTDFQELNQIYSDPTDQDSDRDGLLDGLEFNFFRTSPILADTDGDQLLDGDEVVLANRNPRVADLPLPAIEVGAIDLSLDTRFTATSVQGTRELESKTTSSTLSQAQGQSFSNTDSNTHEFFAKASAGVEYSLGGAAGVGQLTGRFAVETGYTGQWSSSFTRESSQETVRAYESSRQTDVETTREESVTREVVGAAMRATVTLRSIGNIAFTISNVEVTAFTLDPRDPTRLIPVATLRPQSNPGASYNLGPLIPQRGPLIFESTEVFPSTIEALMRNPRGLVFKVANFDLTDEFGRNFAFTSQDINDRTAPLVIDFGGQDGDGDGLSDASARYRVATSSGRTIGDVNGDGVIDDLDRTVFDDRGRQVGITLSEALEDILGLTRYDEDVTPTATLDSVQIARSFSVRTVATPSGPVTILWRVRDVANGEPADRRLWEVLTPTGIERGVDFDDRLLRTEDGITLAFVQDEDGDRVTARWEYLMGCSDQLVDTDGDGLDDYFEIYVGWEVLLPTGSYRVYPSCARTDSDLDGLTDRQESVLGTDPLRADTDGDGVSDFDEMNGYRITLRFGIDPAAGIDPATGFGCVPVTGLTDVVECYTNPLNPDTDGDTLRDGDERRLGTDPSISDGDRALDNDGDGLVNFEENAGWTVTYYAVSTVPGQQGALVTCTPTSFAACGQPPTSNPNVVDTDGDGLPDGVERLLGLHPRLVDTDGDGISDFAEVRFVPGANVWEFVTDPLDADTDDDLRTDGAERDVPIVVRVFGVDPISVFSDPLVADADLDGLVDGQEAAAGTDPTRADTDGDGTSDLIEVNRNLDADATNDTDPLRPDQLLELSYAGRGVRGGASNLICGELVSSINGGNGHFIGNLYYTVNAAETNVPLDQYWGDQFTTFFTRNAIYQGGAITIRAANLQRVEGIDGVRFDLNSFSASPVAGGGGFSPILSATNTDTTVQQVNVAENICAMVIRFRIVPIGN